MSLLFVGTDSFIMSIKTTKLIENFKHFKDDCDFSKLDASHELYDTRNKKYYVKRNMKRHIP